MGGSASTPADPPKSEPKKCGQQVEIIGPDGQKKKISACCACPITKKARDACIVENGEEQCKYLIQAHIQCMRDLGFKM